MKLHLNLLIGIVYFTCVNYDIIAQDISNTSVDSLTYSKQVYDSMRLHFRSDSIFMKALEQKVDLGDRTAVKLNKMSW